MLSFDTSSHEPSNIIIEDTWTIETLCGIPHTYIIKEYTIVFENFL